jgi:protein gp37
MKSKIEWTESTWNPVTGCSKISPGCRNCYAERMARRLKAMGAVNYRNGFEPTWHERTLDLPLEWRQPQTIFVNSMSDLFHESVPAEFIEKVFLTMNRASWHRFQILTKRAKRMLEVVAGLSLTENIWLGVSVESRRYLDRIDILREVPAAIRFLSIEPLLEDLGPVDFSGIDWVVAGGESGPGARPMKEEWVLNIKRQCDEQRVPFFFKQWGGVWKKRAGRLLPGRTWDAMPEEGPQREKAA